MAGLMEYVDYLSSEIGPRPAGTEEEQQAALYITEAFQKDTGFPTVIEDFTSSSNTGAIKPICAAVVLVVSILSMLLPVLSLPAFVLALIACAIYCLESLGKNFVSKALARGASQNVVAKYQPGARQESSRRSRKIVLVAHYDTGKVKPGFVSLLEGFNLPLGLITMGAMGLSVLLLLVRMLFFNGAGGIGIIVFNIINAIALIVVAVPVVVAIMYRFAPYNEGANNNASGVAALIEVARRISAGQVSEADLAAEGIVIHGEDEAREEGLVPEGARIVYEASQIRPNIAEPSEEARLASAKAAIAAFTGVPGARWEPTDIAANLAASSYRPEAEAAAAEAAEAQKPAEAKQLTPEELSASLTQPIDLAAEEQAAAEAPAEAEAEEMPVQEAVEAAAAEVEEPAAEVPAEPAEPTIEEEAAASNLPSWYVAAQRNARRTETEVDETQRSRYSGTLNATEKTIAERDAALREEEERRKSEEAAQQIREAAAAYSAANGLTEAAPAEAEEAVQDELPEAEKPAHDPLDTLFGLPSTEDIAPAGQPQEQENPSRSGIIRKMRQDIPSLSGEIHMPSTVPDADKTMAFNLVSPSYELQTPVVSDATTAMPPMQEELPLEQVQEEAREPYRRQTRGDKPAAEEKPEEKKGLFGGLFQSTAKDDPLNSSPQEWLDVEDDFDPREEGRRRGGWESFRDDYDELPAEADAGENADEQDDRPWYGGGYSRVRLGYADTYSDELSDSRPIPPITSEDIEAAAEAAELEQIYHFRNPHFTTEVWFAAIGSECDTHDGAAAFIEQHRSELRGALIVDVESLGAGTLSLVEEEGSIKPAKVSSRAMRYTQKATESTGIQLDFATLKNEESIASVASRGGYQAMHIAGIENGKLASKGSADDVAENVDAQLLEENVEYLVELVRRF